jgi:dihydroxyacetone kinase
MQFLNASTCAVTEALESFVQSHPHVQLLGGFPDIKVVVRAPLDKNKVAVVSGEHTVPRSTPACLSLPFV